MPFFSRYKLISCKQEINMHLSITKSLMYVCEVFAKQCKIFSKLNPMKVVTADTLLINYIFILSYYRQLTANIKMK